MRGKIPKEMKLLFLGILVLLLIAILANCNGDSGNSVVGPNGGGETCCWRFVKTTFTAPPEQSPNFLEAAWNSIFTTSSTGGGPLLDDCPLKVDILAYSNTEYTFVGNLTAEGSGDVAYTVHVQLMDNANGAVVKEGSRSWRSAPLGTPQASADVDRNVRELAMTFVPLDDLLFAYEGLPQTASVSPEKDPVSAGEQMTIQVTIRASDNSAPQPWQWVVVGVEKGQILNGTPNGEDAGVEYYRFRADDGTITLQYQAPEDCTSDSETIILYNTCNVDPNLTTYIAEDEIGRATFDITCPTRAWIEFEPEMVDCTKVQNCSVRLPFELRESDETGIYNVIGDGTMHKTENPCIYACPYGREDTETHGGIIHGGKVDLRRTPGIILSLEVFINFCIVTTDGFTLTDDPNCHYYGHTNADLENIPWVDGYTEEIGLGRYRYTLHFQGDNT